MIVDLLDGLDELQSSLPTFEVSFFEMLPGLVFIHFGKDVEDSESDPSDGDASLGEGDDGDGDEDVVMTDDETDDDEGNHDDQEAEAEEWHGFTIGTEKDVEESGGGSLIIEDDNKVDDKPSQPMPSGLCPTASYCLKLTIFRIEVRPSTSPQECPSCEWTSFRISAQTHEATQGTIESVRARSAVKMAETNGSLQYE